MQIPLKIGLVQINNSFSGQNYLPYTAGLLQAYAKKHARQPNQFKFLLPLFKRLPVKQAVAHLQEAEIIGFSVSVWNLRISLEIARQLKQLHPSCVIVFGGPQVPDKAEAFLRANPFIDLACHGEGERAFLNVLEHYGERNWQDLDGISHLSANGGFIYRPSGSRLKDLSTIPSPYLSGVFQSLLAAHPGERWLALWETNRGCPFSCAYCDWGSATTAKVYEFDMERLKRETDWFADHKIEFIFCCDANFGILARDLEIVGFAAAARSRTGYPQALSVQNTKNATDRAYQVQKALAAAGLNKGVTISMQSTNPLALKNARRQNISLDYYRELQRRFTRDRVETYSDMILGLPGETYDSFADGTDEIICNGQHNRIQFNNLAILPNAEMGAPEYQRRHGIVTVQTHIINIHGSLAEKDEIPEFQELVVATATMPPADWARTRVFCWMAALLHFDKILQIPLILLHETCGASYRAMIEAFCAGAPAQASVLAETHTALAAKAREMQAGGPEYCESTDWLNIWWPADEYQLIRLAKENKLLRFYQEAEAILARFAQPEKLPLEILHDAIELNRQLLKLPFQTTDVDVPLNANIWEYFQAAKVRETIALERQPRLYHINRTRPTYASWDEWCREVIWYGNKKGAYLYGNDDVQAQLPGHF
jgi:radical SAM superfamily enzyme YgiQ (UPF0313 family)